MQIFLKRLVGSLVILTVESSDSIDQVKKKIEEQEGIPYDKQTIILSGKKLGNEEILNDLMIFKETCFHLIVLLKSKDEEEKV